MRILILFLLFIAQSACAIADEKRTTQINFQGRWQNDMGSELEFTAIKKQVVTGSYNTNVGEPNKSKSFPLVGQVDGDQITFTVKFKGFQSMTAWVGQVTLDKDGKPYLRTLWHNTKNIDDAQERAEIWGSIRTGGSAFYRVP